MLVEALMGSIRIPKIQHWSSLSFFLPVAFLMEPISSRASASSSANSHLLNHASRFKSNCLRIYVHLNDLVLAQIQPASYRSHNLSPKFISHQLSFF